MKRVELNVWDWENFKYFAEELSRKYLQNEYLFGKSIFTLSWFEIVWSHLGVLVYLLIVKLITLTKAFNFLVLCAFGYFFWSYYHLSSSNCGGLDVEAFHQSAFFLPGSDHCQNLLILVHSVWHGCMYSIPRSIIYLNQFNSIDLYWWGSLLLTVSILPIFEQSYCDEIDNYADFWFRVLSIDKISRRKINILPLSNINNL